MDYVIIFEIVNHVLSNVCLHGLYFDVGGDLSELLLESEDGLVSVAQLVIGLLDFLSIILHLGLS